MAIDRDDSDIDDDKVPPFPLSELAQTPTAAAAAATTKWEGRRVWAGDGSHQRGVQAEEPVDSVGYFPQQQFLSTANRGVTLC